MTADQAADSGGLAPRLLTAAVGLPLLALVLWAGNPLVAVAAIVTAVIALREAFGLAAKAGAAPVARAGAAAGIAAVAGAALDGALAVALFGAGLLVVLGAALYRARAADALRAFLATSACAAWVALPLAALVLLRDRSMGLEWAAVAFLAVFATDTCAYFVGKAFGRRKMAPGISPGKTWEGAAGGLAGGLLATAALIALLEIPFHAGAAASLGLAVGVLAQAGDLLESKLKRLADAKDSGALFPGHGGLLDRLDSLLLVFPLVYYAAAAWPL
ncbi:MAG: phosphatidate cytidylyltransferase [Dehalococcoidia bacterium]|nr:phosphatidate cytidylyltransferase [Dehalococcoidia bacterium]